MKRSPMKRKPPPPSLARVREWTGASPSPRAIAVSRVDTRARLVVPVGKEAPVRDEAYRRRAASLPCCHCRLSGFSQAAHGPSMGRGIKASDADVFPLCADRPGVVGCHTRFDRYQLCDRATRHVWAAKWAKETRAVLDNMEIAA